MKFCKNCKNLIRGGKCTNCTFTDIDEIISDNISTKSHSVKIKHMQTVNLVPFECKMCNNKYAIYEIIQTRSLDESPTEFYTCNRCGYCSRK